VRKDVDYSVLEKLKLFFFDKAEEKVTDKYRRRRVKQVKHIQKTIHPKRSFYARNHNIEKDIESTMAYYACRSQLMDQQRNNYYKIRKDIHKVEKKIVVVRKAVK
jgi:hypothetical protein|tara:strand:+ start:3442 stop:3756 length:315 start_codon:yes stop_codon:yes gene_type:complete